MVNPLKTNKCVMVSDEHFMYFILINQCLEESFNHEIRYKYLPWGINSVLVSHRDAQCRPYISV